MTEHLDVIVVGAGLSGIAAAHHLQTTAPWADYAILEMRDAMGGTWDLFRYPGIRSDSDMHTMGYSFRPWKGTDSLAAGPDIREYIEATARDEGIDQHIRYGHRIVAADWSTPDARWNVTAERRDPATGEVHDVQLTAGFVFSCTGYYRYDRGHTPEFPGSDDFTGTIVHPQFWPEDLDYAGQRIVVIGSGATAVTLIPALAETAGHVTMLQRSPTYIASVPEKDHLGIAAYKLLPDRWAGSFVRWFRALSTQWFYEFAQKRPRPIKKMLRKGVERELPDDFDIDTHFTPQYDPWDQRLCAAPAGDIFKVIRDGSASVVTDHIETFTPTGIKLQSGEELEADIIVTATGLELLFLGGIELSVDGDPVEVNERLTYKGMMLEGVPNLAMAVGYTNASWTLKCDLTADYVARLLTAMRERGQAQCTPVNTDGNVSPEPLLTLTAGYIQRSLHLLPRQGQAAPWRNYQSYWRDYRAMKRGEMFDGSLVLSNPTSQPELEGVG
ncbi:MAG: NAD(P)/FAD-dependent oxidoreductase [Acidimicrobiales bacterium]|nr:NAD(P)/FAD-dependent oxidoreductase [Acidimicrobiales bacterium]